MTKLSISAIAALDEIAILPSDRADVIRWAEGLLELVHFRVEVACEGYMALTDSDIPDHVLSSEDYVDGARDAAMEIREALRRAE